MTTNTTPTRAGRGADLTRYARRILAMLAAVLVLAGLAAFNTAPAASAAPASKAQASHSVGTKDIQRRLVAHGYPVTVDGSYGPKTVYAVQDFQRDNGIAPTGFVDNFTWIALALPPAKKTSRPQPRLTNTQAVSRLRAAGITWESSNGCMEKNGHGCTSFTGMLSATLNLAIDLKQRSGCKVVITGAAEVHPHSTTGTRTHGNGYKIDIRPNACLDKFIAGHLFRGKDRGNDPRWLTHSAEYVLEHPKNGAVHWDIKYTL